MAFHFFRRFKILREEQKVKPLVSSSHDVALLRKTQTKRFPRLRQIIHLNRILSPLEKHIFRFASLVFVIGVLWGGYDLFQLHRVSVPAVGGRYSEALVGTPELVNPLFASRNDVDNDITHLVYSGLMRYDKEQRLVPDLAVHYTLSEDKKTYTFDLRHDVTWHDGKPFTSEDVVSTFERIQNTEAGSPLYVSFQGVQVAATDEYTVQFILKEPFQPFLSSLTVGILPFHIWEVVPPSQTRLAKANLQPVGTGPYKFKKFLKQDTGYIFQYELERFAGYYREPAHIQEIVFQFYGSFDGDFGAAEAVREQKVDGLSFVPAKLRDKVEKRHTIVYSLQLPQYTALFFNQKRQPFLENKEVRHALAIAIDRDRIIRESLDGEGQLIAGPVLPGYPWFKADLPQLPYSPDEANAALDKIWERVSLEDYRKKREEEIRTDLTKELTPDQTATSTSSTPAVDVSALVQEQLQSEFGGAQSFYRKDKEGSIIEIRLATAETEEYDQTAKLIAGFWQELGIKTTITRVDPKDIAGEVFKDRKYDVLLYGVIVGSDPDQYPFWHSTQVSYHGLNLAQYVNRKVDGLLETARGSGNDEERVKAYEDFQSLILEDLPAVFLYTPTYRYAVTDKVKGFSVQRIFNPADRFANVTEWYIKTKGQWGK